MTSKPRAVPSPADGVIHEESDNCRSWDGGHLVHFTQGMRANGAHGGTRSFVPCTVTVAEDGTKCGTELANNPELALVLTGTLLFGNKCDLEARRGRPWLNRLRIKGQLARPWE
jgi:hypothetical protein